MSDKLNQLKKQINDLKTRIAVEVNESNRLIEELKTHIQFEKLVEVPAIIASMEAKKTKMEKERLELERKLEKLLREYREHNEHSD
jgi:regulator of replication initiation timing